MSLELMDAGRSEAGFSRVGTAFLCTQLWSYGELLQLDDVTGNRDPLHRGSLVHTGEAHYWEALRRQQALGRAVAEGQTVGQARAAMPLPESLYDPVSAIHRHAEAMRADGIPVKDEIAAISARTMGDLVVEHNLVREKPIVVSVEQEYRALMETGALTGEQPEVRVWAEHTILAQLDAHGLTLYVDPDVPFLRTVGPKVAAHRSRGMNGYSGPTEFYLYTQRIDLVTWEPCAGMLTAEGEPVYDLVISDHKTTNSYRTGAFGTIKAYSMHGQFWGLRLLGELYYPELARQNRIKLRINIIQMPIKGKKTTWIEEPPEPAPWRESRHWRNVHDMYTRLRGLIDSGRDPWDFPATGHEMGCMEKRYGRCGAWELCQGGKASLMVVRTKAMGLLPASERGADNERAFSPFPFS